MKPKYQLILVLFLLNLAAYGSSLKGGFIWDDKLLIVENNAVAAPNHIGQVFISDLYDKSQANYYRPILEFSFIFNHYFSQLNPFGYHFVNLMLHFFVSLLLYLLLLELTKNVFVSLFSSTIFCIHPIHSQVVSYISGRADSLAGIFLLFALIFFLRSDGVLRYIVSIIFFIFALFTKETAISLPFILLIFGSMFFKEKLRDLKRIVPFFAILLLYVVARLTILNFSKGNPFLLKKGFALSELGLIERLGAFFKSFLIYTGSFFVPVKLHMERLLSYEIIYPEYWAGIVIFVGLLILLKIKWRQYSTNEKTVLKFLCIWFFVWLLPQSAFVFPKIMAEHFLYLSSVSLCYLIAFTAGKINSVMIKRAILIFVILYLLGFDWQNNKIWRNELVFFENTVELSPHSIRARDSLAAIYLEAGRYKDAQTQYSIILKLSDEMLDPKQKTKVESSVFYNLGLIFEKTSRLNDSLWAYKMSLLFDPKFVKAYNNMGLIFQKAGDFPKAKACFGKAIEIDPEFYQAYNNLAVLYAGEGKFFEAASLWSQALIIKPDYETAKRNLKIAQEMLQINSKND